MTQPGPVQLTARMAGARDDLTAPSYSPAPDRTT